MSQALQLFQQYYQNFQSGEFDRNLFTDDFTFTGPLARCGSPEEFQEMFKQMKESFTIDNLDFKGQFFSDDGSSAVAIFDFITSKPIQATTRTAEFFTFRDGKISSINLIYDARDWEAVMQQGAAV